MLLFRWLRLWYCLQFRTNNTEPTKMYIHVHTSACTIKYTHMSICVAMFWNLYEFTRF